MRQKGFALIPVIIIIFIILIGGGAVVYTQLSSDKDATANESKTTNTPAPTKPADEDTSIKNLIISGWQTFKDTDMGFTMDYPSDWRVDDFNSSDFYQYRNFEPVEFLNGNVAIEVATSLTEQSICSSDPCQVYENKTVKIGSTTKKVDVYKVENTYGYPYYAFLTSVDRNNDDSLMVLVKYAIPQHLQGINAILETFKFL